MSESTMEKGWYMQSILSTGWTRKVQSERQERPPAELQEEAGGEESKSATSKDSQEGIASWETESPDTLDVIARGRARRIGGSQA